MFCTEMNFARNHTTTNATMDSTPVTVSVLVADRNWRTYNLTRSRFFSPFAICLPQCHHYTFGLIESVLVRRSNLIPSISLISSNLITIPHFSSLSFIWRLVIKLMKIQNKMQPSNMSLCRSKTQLDSQVARHTYKNISEKEDGFASL